MYYRENLQKKENTKPIFKNSIVKNAKTNSIVKAVWAECKYTCNVKYRMLPMFKCWTLCKRIFVTLL